MITSRLIFPDDKEKMVDDFSLVLGQEILLVKLLTSYTQWQVLDIEYENQGNIRILDNVISTINEKRQALRDEYPDLFKEE